MNQFVVSARKYRPATFDTVVGQSHITNTLKNAIRNNHLAQAFLFCGPRGVGKTTCARILAKTINCKSLSESTEACNECESCLSFNGGQSLNIFELDAASNNSVEDNRNLLDQVRFAPHSGQYKIYIIDEVHMLSNAAFNAFLKTLEEPPSYAIFILATTEKHKIIPTILSRCQIFDFNRIQVEDIANHLQYVAGKEGITADPDALHIIAQKADGALRDSLSIFDQIVSFAGQNITYKDVINNLSILDYDYYFKITDDIRVGNIPSVLMTLNELLSDGFDGHHFVTGLGSHFRDLLVCQDPSTVALLEVSKNIKEKYYNQAKQCATGLLLQLLDICSKCDLEYRMAKNQRLHVELALIRMCSAGSGGIPQVTFRGAVNAQHITPSTAPIPTSGSAVAPTPVPTQNIQPVKVDSLAKVAQAPREEAPRSIQPNEKVLAVNPVIDVKETPVAPLPKSTNGNGLPKKGSFLKGTSLASTGLKKEEKVADVPVQNDLPEDAFDQDKLLELWQQYAEKQQLDGNRQMFTTLTMNKPQLKDGYIVELIIHNQAQENLMIESKVSLVDFLRKNLNNYKVTLNTVIEEQVVDPDQAFTNKERYQKMVQKNPDLEEMRKQLGLELEL
jgi:DNA polymerase-3 subunit gamma/tau